MKTAIIYASKHGTTGFVATEIKKRLNGDEVVMYNLNDQQRVELRPFDRIVIGSSIYAGTPLSKVRRFIEQNLVDLLQKQVGIFVCCMFFDKADEQINKGFPEVLRNHARSIKHLGGEFRFEEMNFIERSLVKKISGTRESVSSIKYETIDEFVREISAN
ncbi:MAG: flavodoxin [Alphaproteobacteria bacterium]|nr:flavodoxin [Alphaproteobacteria bacterium]